MDVFRRYIIIVVTFIVNAKMYLVLQ